jgi:hypothetical protein
MTKSFLQRSRLCDHFNAPVNAKIMFVCCNFVGVTEPAVVSVRPAEHASLNTTCTRLACTRPSLDTQRAASRAPRTLAPLDFRPWERRLLHPFCCSPAESNKAEATLLHAAKSEPYPRSFSMTKSICLRPPSLPEPAGGCIDCNCMPPLSLLAQSRVMSAIACRHGQTSMPLLSMSLSTIMWIWRCIDYLHLHC